MASYDYERVRVELDGQVATVYLQWPDGLRARSRVFHTELSDVMQRLRTDDEVRVVVLRGPGDRYFLSAQAGLEEGPEADTLSVPDDSVAAPNNYLRLMNESA